MTEQEVDDLVDAMLSPAPAPEQEGELPVPERTAPEQDKDEFLEAVLGEIPSVRAYLKAQRANRGGYL